MKLPKNIKTMSEMERYKWWQSLPNRVADKLVERTFITYEYAVYADDELQEVWDTLADAKKHFNSCVADGMAGCEIEKYINYNSVADGSLRDRNFESILKGNK